MTRPPTAVVVPSGYPGRTKAERVRAMFARIVPGYDRANCLMTLGLDRRWRRLAVELASPRQARALDVGTGTGDLAVALAEAGAAQVVALDFVPEMLTAARDKLARSAEEPRVSLVCADATSLPFASESFDCVVSGFVLRNVEDVVAVVSEMARVLRPGGRFVCLELTHAPSLIRGAIAAYSHHLVPVIGGLVTGERDAYRYLPASLGPFPDASRLAEILRAAGLRDVTFRRLGAGSVALHRGIR